MIKLSHFPPHNYKVHEHQPVLLYYRYSSLLICETDWYHTIDTVY